MTQRVDVVPGRGCGGCTMCCKLLGVEELNTPPLGWCPNCDTKKGCGIYADRPTECRQFYCEYLLDEAVGEHWRPSKCKMVVVLEDYSNALVIHIDPSRPHAWRQEPFYSDIRRWARAAARRQRQVIVWQDQAKIVIPPEARADLGEPSRVGHSAVLRDQLAARGRPVSTATAPCTALKSKGLARVGALLKRGSMPPAP